MAASAASLLKEEEHEEEVDDVIGHFLNFDVQWHLNVVFHINVR